MLARNHLFFAVTVAAVGHSGCSLPFTDQLGDAALPLRDLAPPTAEQRRLAQRIERRLSEKVVLHDRSEHVLIDGWRRSKSSHGRYQWRHRGLQGLHPELAEQLADAAGFENRVTAASVKVALARRAESPRGLTGIIKDGELPINVRRAAAETLGRLDGTRDSVRKLLAVYRDESTAGETALLYEELLRAAVRSGVELDHPAIIAALTDAEQRFALAVLDEIKEVPQTPLPPEATDLLDHRNPTVKSAAILAAAAQQHDGLIEIVEPLAARSSDFAVQAAAIRALGYFPNDARAVSRLQSLADRESRIPLLAAVAEARIRSGEPGAWDDALMSEAWQIRLAAATNLNSSRQREDVAQRLVRDPSSVVQRAVVERISEWPHDGARQLLLAAFESPSLEIRQLAALALAARWPAARDLRPDDPPAARKLQLAKMGGASADRSNSTQPVALSAAALAGLTQRDLTKRRRAAEQFAQFATEQHYDADSLLRIADRIQVESDTIVLAHLLSGLRFQPHDVSSNCARWFTEDRDTRLRGAAFGILAEQARNTDAQVVRTAIQNETDVETRVLAIEALGRCGSATDAQLLKPLVLESAPEVQVAAALALLRIDSPSGKPALIRLAADGDSTNRRLAAEAMGASGVAEFGFHLRLLLDDTAVRATALSSLERLFPERPYKPGASQSERIAAWRDHE